MPQIATNRRCSTRVGPGQADTFEMDSRVARDLFKVTGPATAFVEVEYNDGRMSVGSAFHVGEGVFVTARHVVEGLTIRRIKDDYERLLGYPRNACRRLWWRAYTLGSGPGFGQRQDLRGRGSCHSEANRDRWKNRNVARIIAETLIHRFEDEGQRTHVMRDAMKADPAPPCLHLVPFTARRRDSRVGPVPSPRPCGRRASSSGRPCRVGVPTWGDACPQHAATTTVGGRA